VKALTDQTQWDIFIVQVFDAAPTIEDLSDLQPLPGSGDSPAVPHFSGDSGRPRQDTFDVGIPHY
jgi:hypothetical protein